MKLGKSPTQSYLESQVTELQIQVTELQKQLEFYKALLIEDVDGYIKPTTEDAATIDLKKDINSFKIYAKGGFKRSDPNTGWHVFATNWEPDPNVGVLDVSYIVSDEMVLSLDELADVLYHLLETASNNLVKTLKDTYDSTGNKKI